VWRKLSEHPDTNAVGSCVEPGTLTTWRDLDEATIQEVLPLPEFCIEHAFQGWWMVRTQACMVRSGLVNVREARTLRLIGQLEFLEINLSYTSGSIETWAQQIEIRMFGGWGLIAGTMVQGRATCTGACAATRSTFPPQLVRTGQDEEGEAFFDTTATVPGSVGRANTTFTYDFFNPAWTLQPPPFQADPPEVRCDNALPGTTQAGCVFVGYTPVMIYDLAGAFPELARHIGDAQQSGLPGAYPNGARLSRLIDPVLQAANRTRACPDASAGGYPRPPGKSCDEYPFASTNQGAATQVPRGPARTFPYCQINEPPGSGPVGYSVCMIDEIQNSVGGSVLGSFYNSNRVLDQDQFYVWITGGGGGGFPAPIRPSDQPPSVNAGPDVAGDEGSPVQLHGSASDEESTPTIRWTYDARDDVDEGTTCTFGNPNAANTTITCTDDGTFTVTLTASDGVNPPVSDNATLRLANVAPTVALTGAGNWQPVQAGTAVPLTAAITDPGTNDTHTCSIRWDDGTTTTGPAVNRTCGSGHTFASPGMFTVNATVADDDGGVGQSEVMVIVYDPDAGFPTAAGHLNSPPGAITAAPTSTGTAHFNLNPEYGPHDTGPEPRGGKVQFRVDSTTFDLRSAALEWLVVTPNDLFAVKGTGTVNGVAGYSFVAYGYDAQPDRLRLVVWPLSSGPIPGSTLTYDNRRGASYDLDLANPQPIDAGSIQVHN